MHTSPVPVAPSNGALSPIPIDRVVLDGGFWGTRQRLNADAIIPHCLEWETKAGWVDNFAHAADGTVHEHRRGREFSDSEIYKLLEAMAWEFGRSGDASLDAEIERLGAMLQAVQRKDGYLSTKYDNPGQKPRYSNFEWGHELYNYGHLIQAAVARIRTGRADSVVVDVARKVADHVVEEFGEGASEKICGHPEIEVALSEFARATGDDRYLQQSKLFIERRGHGILADIEWGRSYYQDHKPYRDTETLIGHSVRALYLTSAAIDVAVDTGDSELLEIAKRQYDNALARRTYITGGMGSHHQDEAFGEDYELPPDRSYCETCAGIGSVMVGWRLLLATGDLSYGDAIERALYNVVAASPQEDGKAFFYSNTLHRRTPAEVALPDVQVPRANSSLRAPWFNVSCCPTNLARTLASLSGYIAARTDDGVALVQYAAGKLELDGIGLLVETAYPYEGQVRVTVTEASEPFALDLRIPAWADGATVDGGQVAPGTHRVAGLGVGDVVVLEFPIEPRIQRPDPRIDAVRGSIAVERGPLVLCVESVDLPDGMSVNDLVVDPTVAPRAEGAGAVLAGRRVTVPTSDWPYADDPGASQGDTFDVPLVPYHSWANRGPATMRVWLPTT